MKFPELNSFEEFEALKQTNPEILQNAAEEVIRRHNLPDKSLDLFVDGTNIVFAYGNDKVIKIFPPLHQQHFIHETLVLKHLKGKLSVETPIIEYEGEIDGWPYFVMTRLDGTLLESLWDKLDHSNKLVIMRELGNLIREVHALPTTGLEAIDCHWEKFLANQFKQCVDQHRATQLAESLIQQIPEYLAVIKPSLPKIQKPVLLTGEYTPMNLLVKQIDGVWHITGLIDFGDSMLGLPQYDLLGPGAFLIQGDKELLNEFLSAYGYSSKDMNESLSHQFTALMLLHRYSNLRIQIRIKDWKTKVKTLKDLENLVWGFDSN
jgi:hygromycin-B 7''-O-kinase